MSQHNWADCPRKHALAFTAFTEGADVPAGEDIYYQCEVLSSHGVESLMIPYAQYLAWDRPQKLAVFVSVGGDIWRD